MKHLIWLVLLIACAPKTSTPAVSASGDPLRTNMKWASDSPWWANDLDPSIVGDQIVHWVTAYDEECEMAVNLDGNGNMTSAFSVEVSTPQGSDAPCSYYDGTWTYSVANSTLTLCPVTAAGGPCVDMIPASQAEP